MQLEDCQRVWMTPIDNATSNMTDSHMRPKRQRTDPHRFFCNTKFLELEGIIKVLREYEDYDGGINCSICGKLYRSKVCFTKHLWEHSVYWDLFDGERNQDRVLSIQAALILYSGNHGYAKCGDNGLSFLLVTAPHSEKKRGDGGSEEDDRQEVEKKRATRRSPTKRRSTSETSSPEKKTRSPSVSEASSSDTEVVK